MKIFFITFFFLFSSPADVFAQGEMVNYSPKIITGYYQTKEGDDLERIFSEELLLRPELPKSRIKKLSQLTKSYNPFIQNWNQLPAGTKIYIELPFDAVTSNPFKQQKKIVSVEKVQAEDTVAKDADSGEYSEKIVRYSVSAVSSLGTFKEKSTTSGSTVITKQFSPVTLGAAISIADAAAKWSFLSSAYYSFIAAQDVPSGLIIQNTSVNPPAEIGLNAYAQRMMTPQLFSLYAGVDAERFSTLNLIQIEQLQSNVLSIKEHTVVYGTIGSSFYLQVKNQPINLRLSYSHSVVSDVSFAQVKAYEGYKAILYLQVPFKEHFYISSFYKFHKMSGESELTINRIGAGIGYLF